MTDAHHPDLDALDRTARAAAAGLREHVDRQVEPELMLAALPPTAPSPNRGRLMATAAVVALLLGSVAVLSDGPRGDDRSRLEVDEDGNPLPPPPAGVLTPLGPNDGRDSIQLPVTVEPNEGLADGEAVTVTSPGFEPRQGVGIVQCASEAGEGNGGEPEERAGIDACDVGGVQYADADADGVATGTIKVRRVLTTPATGTVDCAAEPQRCIVAMGAIADYDRSGGYGIAFRDGAGPIELPTLTVSPSEGLGDGALVRVEGEGFEPGPVELNVCSADPSACWSVGEPYEVPTTDVELVGPQGDEAPAALTGVGLVADERGRVSGDVQVWGFLPTAQPGSYVDCAVSRCSLRASPALGGFAPEPPALRFVAGDDPPQPPAVAASPTRDVEPGGGLVVRGSGFRPGDFYSVSFCASSPADPADVYACVSPDGEQRQIDPDGGFAVQVEYPDISGLAGEAPTTTACATDSDCGAPAPSREDMCDSVRSICTIRVEVYTNGPPGGPPQFAPVPIPFTYRA